MTASGPRAKLAEAQREWDREEHPRWTLHEVEPVTRGQRWVLLVNGRGRRCGSRDTRSVSQARALTAHS